MPHSDGTNELSREGRIKTLLATYVDALEYRDLQDAAREASHMGSRLLLYGSLWHAGCAPSCPRPGMRCQSSYAKLEACLGLLKREHPDLYWHVVHRYVHNDVRSREVEVKNGRYVGLPPRAVVKPTRPTVRDTYRKLHERGAFVRAMVETWDEGVNMRKVEEGVTWLARVFPGDPTLPQEIYRQLAA